jgi:sporulation protein YlmC with PRC-barrel domain
MQFNKDASVYSSDGKDLGHLDRVVLDPKTKELTHLVIRQGFFFTEDKIVPMHLVESSTEDRVSLKHMADVLDLPQFEEKYYLSADELDEERTRPAHPEDYVAPLLWYPPLGTAWWSPAYGYANLETEAVIERNIPEGTVPLKEGAEVISADGEHVGDIERVFTDGNTNRATHLVISKGLLFKSKKLIPTSWVATTEEDKIELNLGTYALDNLPSFDG